MTVRSVVIHGHYYQPPREDPWLDEVPHEPSAAPAHDWNERIERECYRAVVAARVPGVHGRIARIVNALARTSFDVGPTLFEWLEREAPGTTAAIVEADRASRARLGHGNAIAMPYHHVILPLASRRDKTTEVRWGMADFRRRYGREPEGMWLPETAVDDETLDVLAQEGIAFTVLAPHQVRKPPPHGRPGRYRTRGGRTVALFIYDGDLSHDVAFGPLIRDARAWTARLTASPPGGLVSIATDGETYGHHHRFGEMALAAVLEALAARPDVRVVNFASFLAGHPAVDDVELVDASSWSCPHGVERWRADCGCRIAPERATSQAWRAPLREALDWLAGETHALFARDHALLLGDPWASRDAWLPAGDTSPRDARARELLEMERHLLRAFTSCGWFFDDVGGVETLLVLRHAARAIDLAGTEAPRLEAGVLERLARAVSNDPSLRDGAAIWRASVRPALPPPLLVAAGAVAAERTGCAGLGVRGYATRVSGDAVRLEDTRTARVRNFTVARDALAQRPPALDLRGEDGANHTVNIGALSEPYGAAVRRELALRRAGRWLGSAAAADRPGHTLGAEIGRHLEVSIETLAGNHDPEAVDRAGDLAAALELLGEPVPFDAQSLFYRIRAVLPPERAAALAGLADLLGFEA